MLYDPKWEVRVDNDVVRVLRTAKHIISDPVRWTCGEYARTLAGRCVGAESASAVSFCSVGALAAASGTSAQKAETSRAYGFLDAAAQEMGCGQVHELNDAYGHEKAMAMFDRAIELAAVA